MTNYERIKAMSVEKVAKIIVSKLSAEEVPFCKNTERCDDLLENGIVPTHMCEQCAREWLESEVQE